MRFFMIIIVLGSLTLGCEKKPQTGPGSDAYNRDKAYYESFLDAYTYANGSCVKGCEKINGKCVPIGDTFIAGSYGSDYVNVIPKSRSLPGQGASIYWKRNIDDIPDAFPQYFEWFDMDDRFTGKDPYSIGAKYYEYSEPITNQLNSGYTIPNNYTTSYSSGFFMKVNRRMEGDTFYMQAQLPLTSLPMTRVIDGKDVMGFISGSFSPDFKQMYYHWDYYLRDYSSGSLNLIFYKRTKRVTLDFH